MGRHMSRNGKNQFYNMCVIVKSTDKQGYRIWIKG